MADTKNTEIKFGTDGWRGVISDNFTFKNVRIIAQAVGEWVNRDIQAGQKTLAVGYDTRFLSEEYARLVSCVLAQNGINVFLSNSAIPTPALSYGVLRTKSVAGIMHEVLLAATKVFLVLRMLRVAVDRNRRCVFHRGLYHDALKIFSFRFLFHKQATLHFFRC